MLQALYNLSDDQVEFQIGDRPSFMRFLGIGMSETVPDAKTIWLFRERLTEAGALARLFALFDARLRKRGYLAMSGQIIDASRIPAPRQRNTETEKAAIKEGRSAAEIWPAPPARAAQKDTDARWTVTDAARHEGAHLIGLVDKTNTASGVWADEDSFFRNAMGAELVDYYVHIKNAEIERFQAEVTEWEQREYFEMF